MAVVLLQAGAGWSRSGNVICSEGGRGRSPPQRLVRIIESPSAGVKRRTALQWPELVAASRVVCYSRSMLLRRAWTHDGGCRGGLCARRRLVRPAPPRHRGRSRGALPGLHRSTRCRRGPVRRARSSPTGSSTARSTACCTRSIRIRASSTRAATPRCASGRKATTTASASPSRRSTATSRRQRLRRLAGLPARHPPRRHRSPRSTGESAKGWASDKAVSKLKGPKGTSVKVSIKRRGFDDLIELTVERDEVNIPSIQGAFMIDERTGYVRLRDFSEITDRDLGRALDAAARQGHAAADARSARQPGRPARSGDPGLEPLPAARRHDRLHARPGPQLRPGLPCHGAGRRSAPLPVIVLVNRNSASASEIVSGALQDHDRALVVGETTFGKALVQSVYRIAGEAGLALTTARYYTPSGRLIQRPWDGTFDEYLTYSFREQDDQPREHKGAELKHTDAGRQGLRRRRHRAGQAHDRPDRGLQPGPVRAVAARPAGLRRLRAALLRAGRHPHRRRQGSPPGGRGTSPSTTRWWPTSRPS